jgi:hypothetical protein
VRQRTVIDDLNALRDMIPNEQLPTPPLIDNIEWTIQMIEEFESELWDMAIAYPTYNGGILLEWDFEDVSPEFYDPSLELNFQEDTLALHGMFMRADDDFYFEEPLTEENFRRMMGILDERKDW